MLILGWDKCGSQDLDILDLVYLDKTGFETVFRPRPRLETFVLMGIDE